MTRNLLITAIILCSMGLSHAGGGSKDDSFDNTGQVFGEGEPVNVQSATVQTGETASAPITLTLPSPLKGEGKESASTKIEDLMLIAAVIMDDLISVKKTLKNGADPDYRADDERTPLTIAAIKGNQDIANTLIAHGADVNKKGRYNHTPLIAASINDYPDIIKLLLGKGADSSIKADNGLTALISAVHAGSPASVEVLLTGKTDTNLASSNNMTPLMHAARRGNVPIIKLLITIGKADMFLKNSKGKTALDLAVEWGRADASEFLAKAMAEKIAAQKGTIPGGYQY
ncbi:ankyrin repeat domain-containing protein [Elusimicrobiota bacterium]